MMNGQILPLRTQGKWRGQGQSSSNNFSTIIYFCFLWTWSKSKPKTWLINFLCDPSVLKHTHHPQPLTIKPESRLTKPTATSSILMALRNLSMQSTRCTAKKLFLCTTAHRCLHPSTPWGSLFLNLHFQLHRDGWSKPDRKVIQVATNKFHNVLNKGNSRRMDVHCYRYEREREWGWWILQEI